jgi:hypothetical protein
MLTEPPVVAGIVLVIFIPFIVGAVRTFHPPPPR